jgi:hypothetical protein
MDRMERMLERIESRQQKADSDGRSAAGGVNGRSDDSKPRGRVSSWVSDGTGVALVALTGRNGLMETTCIQCNLLAVVIMKNKTTRKTLLQMSFQQTNKRGLAYNCKWCGEDSPFIAERYKVDSHIWKTLLVILL